MDYHLVLQIYKIYLRGENPKGLTVSGYSVPESSAWRGMMSNGVRISLEWKDKDTVEPKYWPTSDIFYKRIVMSDLSHARDKLKDAPHKLVRDVKSYQVETSFLTSRACQYLIEEGGLKLNKVLDSDLRPAPSNLGPAGQLESRFGIFLEYFQESDGGWKHQWLLSEQATKAALAELAKLHAYFWQGSEFWKKQDGAVGKELESIVWPNGGYMQPNLQGLEQLEKVHSGWEARYPTFQAELEKVPELEGADLLSLGKRLEAVAPRVGQLAHPFSDEGAANDPDLLKYKTLIHGDPKQANFFFRPGDNGAR